MYLFKILIIYLFLKNIFVTALMYELYEYANPKQLVFPNRTDLMHALQMVKNAQYGNMLDIYEVYSIL